MRAALEHSPGLREAEPARTGARTAPGMEHPGLAEPPAEVPVLRHTLGALVARGSMVVGRGLGLVLLTRALGRDQFGVYSLLFTTCNVFLNLGCFGIENAHLYLAGRRPRLAPFLVGNSMLLSLILGSGAAGLLVAVVEFLRPWFFTGTTHAAVLWSAAAIPGAMLQNSLCGIVLGLGRFRYYGAVEAVKWTAYLGAVAALYATRHLDVASALGCLCVVLTAAALVHLGVLTAVWGYRPRFRPKLVRRSLRTGRSMLLVHLTQTANLRLDVYAVRLFASTGLVGEYALASRLSEIFLYATRSFSLVVFSGMARGSDPSKLRMRSFLRWILTLATVSCGVLVAAHDEALRKLFGETAVGCSGILLLRMPGVLAMAFLLLFSAELLGRGRPDLVVRGNLLGIVLLVAGAWPLTIWKPGLGTAVAFSIAAVVQSVWITRAVRRERAAHISAGAPPTSQPPPLGWYA